MHSISESIFLSIMFLPVFAQQGTERVIGPVVDDRTGGSSWRTSISSSTEHWHRLLPPLPRRWIGVHSVSVKFHHPDFIRYDLRDSRANV